MSMLKMKHEDGRTALVEDFQKPEFEAEGFTEVNPKPEPPKAPDNKGKK